MQRQLITGGVKSATVTTSGVVSDGSDDVHSAGAVIGAYVSGKIVPLRIVSGAGDTYTGDFLCSSIERTGENADAESYSCTFESAGPLDYTATIPPPSEATIVRWVDITDDALVPVSGAANLTEVKDKLTETDILTSALRVGKASSGAPADSRQDQFNGAAFGHSTADEVKGKNGGWTYAICVRIGSNYDQGSSFFTAGGSSTAHIYSANGSDWSFRSVNPNQNIDYEPDDFNIVVAMARDLGSVFGDLTVDLNGVRIFTQQGTTINSAWGSTTSFNMMEAGFPLTPDPTYVYEVLVWNSELSDAEMQQAYQYLYQKHVEPTL